MTGGYAYLSAARLASGSAVMRNRSWPNAERSEKGSARTYTLAGERTRDNDESDPPPANEASEADDEEEDEADEDEAELALLGL